MNIFLIGYRCTGKTAAGIILANRFEWGFFDADVELVKEAGKSIKEIVESEGWESFRDKEQSVINRVCALDSLVVATGGGVVLNAENVHRMKQRGILIWLRASAATIEGRLQKDPLSENFRPALTDKGVLREIEETLITRQLYYEKAMDFFIHTDEISIDETCDMIILEFEKRGLRN